MSNIAKAFHNASNTASNSAYNTAKAFIPFIICGDPDLATTAAAVRAAVANGADMIELGIPFSDPTVAGPVIQGANQRALQGGISTDKIFQMVVELRRDVDVPLVLMTYANVLLSYGGEKFIAACKNSGIDGLLVPDLPFEEKGEFLPLCRKYGIDLISVIAPAAKSRIAMIAKEAEGFVYIAVSPEAMKAAEATDAAEAMEAVEAAEAMNAVYAMDGADGTADISGTSGTSSMSSTSSISGISSTSSISSISGISSTSSISSVSDVSDLSDLSGVSGMDGEILTGLAAIVRTVRENASVPCAVGPGIFTPEQAKKMADISDGAVAGSAIIRLLEQYGRQAPEYIGEYVHEMKSAMLAS